MNDQLLSHFGHNRWLTGYFYGFPAIFLVFGPRSSTLSQLFIEEAYDSEWVVRYRFTIFNEATSFYDQSKRVSVVSEGKGRKREIHRLRRSIPYRVSPIHRAFTWILLANTLLPKRSIHFGFHLHLCAWGGCGTVSISNAKPV